MTVSQEDFDSSPSRSPLNLLAVALVALTGLTCLCYAAVFFVPGLAGPLAAPTPVLAVVIVSSTPTVGPPAMPPTWTPTVTAVPTETPSPPPTWTPEATPTLRNTATRVPTRTPVTPSATFGPSPTASPTRSRYPFTAEVTYQPSPINACGASYILGTITDLDGQPVTSDNMIIRVEGDADIDTGSTLRPGLQFRGKGVDGRSPFTGLGFGPSAWSVVINLSGTSAGTWRVVLLRGPQVSDVIEVRLQSDCSYSAAIVRFQQNHK